MFYVIEKHKIPIGIINSSVGGSPAQAWISEDALKPFSNYFNETQLLKNDSYIKNIEDKNKSTTRKGWEFIAGAHCTDPSCGCTITEKAKIETEFCPKQKWLAVKSENSDKLTIETDSNKVTLTFDDKHQKYIADYGNIPFQFESTFSLLIKDEGLSNLDVRTSCGCTSASPKFSAKGIELTIKYDTLRIGGINKNVRVNYKKDGKLKQTIINIKGHVKNAK